jgi:hypothetical protein
MDICLLWVLCVVRYRSLRRGKHSSRGALPTVVRRFVCDLETLWMRRPWPALGRRAIGKKMKCVTYNKCVPNRVLQIYRVISKLLQVASSVIVGIWNGFCKETVFHTKCAMCIISNVNDVLHFTKKNKIKICIHFKDVWPPVNRAPSEAPISKVRTAARWCY